MSICELCKREVDHTTRHHLIPRTLHRNKWFKKNYSSNLENTLPNAKSRNTSTNSRKGNGTEIQ